MTSFQVGNTSITLVRHEDRTHAWAVTDRPHPQEPNFGHWEGTLKRALDFACEVERVSWESAVKAATNLDGWRRG